MLDPEPSKEILKTALKERFSEDELKEISPVWNQTLGCWTFGFKGMTWGVEPDGYIHT